MFGRFQTMAIGFLAFNLSALGAGWTGSVNVNPGGPMIPAGGTNVCQNADIQCPGKRNSNVCIFGATGTAYVVLAGEANSFNVSQVPTPPGIMGAGLNYQGNGFSLHIGTDDAPEPGGTPSDLTVPSLDLNAEHISCSFKPVPTSNCAQLKNEFNTKASADRSCRTASDCKYAAGAGGYSILVGSNANTGQLGQILDQYFQDQCMPEINGPMCMAIEATQCENGTCQGGGCGIIVDLQ